MSRWSSTLTPLNNSRSIASTPSSTRRGHESGRPGVGKSATPWETLKYGSAGSKFDSMEGNGVGYGGSSGSVRTRAATDCTKDYTKDYTKDVPKLELPHQPSRDHACVDFRDAVSDFPFRIFWQSVTRLSTATVNFTLHNGKRG